MSEKDQTRVDGAAVREGAVARGAAVRERAVSEGDRLRERAVAHAAGVMARVNGGDAPDEAQPDATQVDAQTDAQPPAPPEGDAAPRTETSST